MFPEGRQRYQELRNNGVSKNQDDEKFESTSIDDLNALDKPQSARRIIGSHIDLMNERSKSFNLGTSKRMPDSHDYEPDESDVWRSFKEQRFKSDKGKWWTTMRRVSLLRWLITFAIGVCTGLTAILVSLGTDVFTRLKFDMTNNIMDKSGGPSFFVFLIFCSFNMIYVAMANLMVYIEPLSAGSGIPDIKCFLNGTSVLGVVRLRVFFCKVIGVMFSVAGGLPAGKEGPMVHSGSVIASAISQGGDISCAARGSFQDFRNDREKRDFVASGAAAGVAAAFGSPIGGVLFSLEEGASFWSTRLTWRAFFCAMVTVFTLYIVKSSENMWGQQDLAKMFSLGEFGELTSGHGSYNFWELSLFLLLGCMGGLVGAFFNHCNEKIYVWRKKNMLRKSGRRFLEAVGVALIMSIIAFLMPLIWHRCTPKPVDIENLTVQEKNLLGELVSFNCDPQTEYNEVASLYFTDADTAIRQLFHFREGGDHWTADTQTFSSGALFLFWLPYVCMACVTYGVAIPSGLFVPSLLSGAAMGRMCGHLLHKLGSARGALFADSGTYALIGAAATLGGMARMTISLTVILLEATGDMQYVLPLMLTLMAARWTGNVFNEGLYDIHINLRQLTFLEDETPAIAAESDICAADVMTTDVKCLKAVEDLDYIYHILRHTEHGCFPIVEENSDNVLIGTVLRKCLCVLLQHHSYSPTKGVLNWDTLEAEYPQYPTIQDIHFVPGHNNTRVDLRPYMNTAPHVMNESASLSRTYRLFRTLGLRHLWIVNHHNKLQGIITRTNLGSAHLKQRAESLLERREGDIEDENGFFFRGVEMTSRGEKYK